MCFTKTIRNQSKIMSYGMPSRFQVDLDLPDPTGPVPGLQIGVKPPFFPGTKSKNAKKKKKRKCRTYDYRTDSFRKFRAEFDGDRGFA